MIVLRSDQEEVRGKLRVALRSNASVLVFAPTGFGKTVLAAALIKLIFEAKKRVIFCVHRVDLIIQTAVTFEKFGIPFSYIASGFHFNPHHRVFIASISTLQNRLGKIPAEFIMVDEAHLSAATGWAKVANHYKELGCKLIGLTGSPERLDGKPLGDVWDTMVMGPSVRWLIDNGHLSTYRAFAPAGLDMTGIHSRDGEFVASEVDDLMAGKAILSDAVKWWRKFCSGRRTIAFSRSVARSEELAAEFRSNGVVAVSLDGNTPQGDRKKAFEGFADRQIDVIVNCNLFCEGFDLSAQVNRDVTIEAVLQHSPTLSLAKHLQQLGRGLRKKPEPAILLDLVGNLARLGLPDEEREWSLDGRRKPDREGGADVCPKCWCSHSPAPKCPDCGHVYVAKKRESLGARGGPGLVDGEVEELDLEAVRKAKKDQHAEESRKLAEDLIEGRDPGLTRTMRQELEYLLKQATAKGYKSPEKWAAHILTARQAKFQERYGAGR